MKKTKENKKNDETLTIPHHTTQETSFIITAVLFGIIAFFFFGRMGLTFNHFLTPITTFGSIATHTIAINIMYLFLGVLFLSISFAATILFSLIKDKKKVFFFIIPPVLGIVGTFFFNGMFGMGILCSYFVIEYLVSKDKHIFKKLSISYITNHAVGKAMLIINLTISLVIIFTLVNNTSYADMEINNILSTTSDQKIDVNNLDTVMMAQQKNASMTFTYSILDSIENSFSNSPTCKQILIDNRPSVESQISDQIDEQIKGESGKFEKIKELFNLIREYYPYLTALSVFAILQFFTVIIVFSSNIMTLLFYKVLKRKVNFCIPAD
ncbi:MAG: hypothetical protein WC755_01345 [Candidatus Woesearchaeota archaeon]|jgi:hypothetical protein